VLPGSKKAIHQLLRKLIWAPPGRICSLPAPTSIDARNRNPPDYATGLFETPATAHLGRARRTGDRQWVAEDNNGQAVAIIRRGDPTLPAVFRCEPTPDVHYADTVEAESLSLVLNYALNNFSLAAEESCSSALNPAYGQSTPPHPASPVV
jgi:hypothetical protein